MNKKLATTVLSGVIYTKVQKILHMNNNQMKKSINEPWRSGLLITEVVLLNEKLGTSHSIKKYIFSSFARFISSF